MAFVRRDKEIGLVDANGVLLNMTPALMAAHHYSFPVVAGIEPREPLSTRAARMKIYQRFVADLDSGGEKVSDQLSEVDLSDPEDVKVLMPEQGSDILAHFGEDNFLSRYKNYKAHLAEWRQQYPHLAAVDLRYEHQVVLEMEKGTQMASNETPAAKSAPEATDAAPKPAAKVIVHPAAAKPHAKAPDAGGEPMSERAENLITVLDAGSTQDPHPGGRPERRRAALSRSRRSGRNRHAQGIDRRAAAGHQGHYHGGQSC